MDGLLLKNDMKMKSLTATAFLTAFLAAAPGSRAASPTTDDVIRGLRNVAPPELPAKAAEVVNNAPRDQRSAVANAVLDAIQQSRPASAGAVRAALLSSGALPAPHSTSTAAPVTAIGVHVNTPNVHSRFDIAPPHGGNPPGLNGQPGRHGPPSFVDYSKPRGF
jgi:hypothetical protein